MLLQHLESSKVIDHKSLNRSTFNPKEYKLVFPQPAPRKRTPAAVLDRAHEIIYRRENSINTPVYNKNSDTKQLTGLLNVLLSIIGVFVSVFYLGELAHMDMGLRVLVSLLGGLVVAFAEIWFYSKDLRNFD